ncbi:MAG: penicillin-binding protein 2 [Acidimicrobiia bacterium]
MRRLGFCTVVVVIVFGVLAARVVQLQVMSGDRFRAMALDQRLRTVPIAAARGSIFDRNGRDLAMSIERSSVYADPTLVTDPAMYAAQLAPIVGGDAAMLETRLSDRERRFVYVARTVTDEVADQIRALGLPGVSFVPEPQREYPAGSVAAAVVGRVGGEGYGLDGLEALYDELLTGTPGEFVAEQDQHGREIPDTERRRVPAVAGTDLVLTLDQALQYQVERSLVDQVTATAALGGMAVVVDVRTGDVVAMATVQGATATEPVRPARSGENNKPLTDLFEPGSTNKLITVATAIENGIVGPQTPFDVPTYLQVGDKTYTDTHRENAMERWSTTDILRESSNIGTIMIAQHVGKEKLAQALRDFGFGERTAIDYPGQPNGLLLDPAEYYTTGLASSAIGYGIAVTAMQMVDVYATIANNGMTVPPRLLAGTIDADGDRTEVPSEPGKQVISAETAQTMTTMLTQVVRGGTGACAAVEGYTVAGKTGTSRKPAPGGGYSSSTMASFVGFAPAEDPRFAAIVVLDEPVTEFGARASAPVFSEIVRAALTQYRVPPTDTDDDRQFDAARAKAAEEANDCSVPHGDALTEFVAERDAAAAAAAAATSAADADDGGSTEDESGEPDTLAAETSAEE